MNGFSDATKQRAYAADPECWKSYSGKTLAFKRQMDYRRAKALAEAEDDLDSERLEQHVQDIEQIFNPEREPFDEPSERVTKGMIWTPERGLQTQAEERTSSLRMRHWREQSLVSAWKAKEEAEAAAAAGGGVGVMIKMWRDSQDYRSSLPDTSYKSSSEAPGGFPFPEGWS